MNVKNTESHGAGTPNETDERAPFLVAYRISDNPLPLKRSSRQREWMENGKHAYRCLPLTIANQFGWEILNPASFSVIWNGSLDKDGIAIEFHEEESQMIESHFGLGVLTFSVGYLFRTSPGHELWVSGPSNSPKDGIYPLEGLVETDWAPFTFTMNWKLTRPRQIVTFEKGEPICRIVPYPKRYIEEYEPEIRDLSSDPELAKDLNAWGQSRREFNYELQIPGSEASKKRWMRHYVLGVDQSGRSFKEQHRVKLELRQFVDKVQKPQPEPPERS